MKFVMEDDCLAVITEDKYASLKAKAEANEGHKDSVIPGILGAAGTALILGTMAYVGVQVVQAVERDERCRAMTRESRNLSNELEDLKRKMGDA